MAMRTFAQIGDGFADEHKLSHEQREQLIHELATTWRHLGTWIEWPNSRVRAFALAHIRDHCKG